MISHFLSIIDRLIKLKEHKDKRFQDLFQQIIEPIFNDLLIIHSNYISTFLKARARLSAISKKNSREYGKAISEISIWLSERRYEYEPIRTKLKSIAHEMGSYNISKEVDYFIDTILEYFPKKNFLLKKPKSKWYKYKSEMRQKRFYWVPGSHLGVLMRRIQETSKKLKKDENVSEKELKEYLAFRSEIDEDISYTIQLLRDKWSIICESYAHLKCAAVNRI